MLFDAAASARDVTPNMNAATTATRIRPTMPQRPGPARL
jgi:hypothetical protein